MAGPVAGLEAGDAFADRVDDAGALRADHRREADRIEAGAMVGVDEVQPDRLVADADLARSGLGDRQIDRLEDFGPAGAGGLDREHG